MSVEMSPVLCAGRLPLKPRSVLNNGCVDIEPIHGPQRVLSRGQIALKRRAACRATAPARKPCRRFPASIFTDGRPVSACSLVAEIVRRPGREAVYLMVKRHGKLLPLPNGTRSVWLSPAVR